MKGLFKLIFTYFFWYFMIIFKMGISNWNHFFEWVLLK